MTLSARVKALQEQIYETQYYVRKYERILHEYDMTPEGIRNEQYKDELYDMLGEFWWQLPDNPTSRTGPFWELTDILDDQE